MAYRRRRRSGLARNRRRFRRTFRRGMRRRRASAMRRGRGYVRTTSLIPFVSGQEFKFFDTTIDETDIPIEGLTGDPGNPGANPVVPPTNENLLSVNLVGQGTGASQRVGRKLTITSLFIKAFISLREESTTPSVVVRMIVYQDMQCNGTGLARVADLIESSGNETLYLGYMNLANRGRFRILANKIVTLNAGTQSGNQPVDDDDDMDDKDTKRNETTYAGASRHVTVSVPRLRVPVEIAGTGTDPGINQITSNNIGILYLTSHNNQCMVEHMCRIRFSDK